MTAELIALQQGDAYEMGICKQVGDALEHHYPGWMWMIACPAKQGIVVVKSGYMDPKYGFVIRLNTTFSASELTKQAVQAGGELLERTGMPRSRYSETRDHAAANKNALDFLTFQK